MLNKNIRQKFFTSHKGSIAPTFAIAMIPIFLAAGAALDYTRMADSKSKMQNALDTAVLAGGKQLLGKEKGKIKASVRKFLKANLEGELYSQIGNIDIDIDRRNKSLTGTITANSPTTILQLMARPELKYEVVASTEAAAGAMEVVMVLDNTYSMSVESKLSDLKSAATEFVTELMEINKYERQVKVGIVPFSQYVNVGMDNRRASWMDVPADSSTTQNVCRMKKEVISKSGCVSKTGYNDGVPYTYESCNYTYGPEKEVCGPETSTTKWYGCVGSRVEPLNLRDGSPAKRFPGAMNQQCPSRLTQLTYDKGKLLKEIKAMVATGETYIPTGIMWGLRTISAAVPFREGVNYKKAKKNNVHKIIILMTDGDNQRSAQLPDSPLHWGNDLDQANDWTLTACDAVKGKDIALYGVTFGKSISGGAQGLIKRCASSASHYFHAASGTQLKEAFGDILASINKLRLTQ